MKNLKKLFEILGKWKTHYLFSAVLLTVSIAFRMLEPKILQLTVDKVVVFFIQGESTKFSSSDYIVNLLTALIPELKIENLYIILIYLAALFLVISLLRGSFMFISSAMSAASTERAVKQLRDKLFSHIQQLPLEYFSKTPAGELIQRCTGDVETVRKFASLQVVEMLRMLAIFTGAFIMMSAINVAYALIAVVAVPLITFGSIYFFKKESKVWTEHEKQQDKLTALVQENLSGIRVVKAFAKEEFEIGKFTAQNLEKRGWGLKLMNLHSIFWPSSDLIVHLQIALSIFAGGYFVLTNAISVGEYVAFYSYAVLVTWPMRRVGQLVSDMGMTSVAIQRIYSILNYGTEDYSGNMTEDLNGKIEFENVCFRYNKNDNNFVLNGVTFTVNPGDKIALLGPAGSGKTTVISLLLRFFEPDSGIIKIDGKNINQYSRAFLRDRFGVVLQKPFLFSATLLENIAYSDPDSHIDEVMKFAKAAHIHEIIEEKFPKSYETVVGERGVTLSGGQKQRVAIARTLLKNPDILVLDDSTSSVDSETEFNIQKSMRRIMKDKTVFIIAHRITSITDCDRIIVLDKGKVAECGTHEELLLNNGFYKRIHDIQLSIEAELEKETDGREVIKDDLRARRRAKRAPSGSSLTQ
jgi:ATP-binding cassette, subfamily B, bacterial